ncbi:PREDICTED: GRIP and coiled-coil domain-containing protein 2 [Rhagoletis zephyria]|uniref:GRIP and coiled-coil domain-containing protein 2 n=1 Tax=Rhagoletis zephyria TaxID=28612 RepID=UPI0008114ADB|nr:PREDICTED: GRIP and coiled-coil domain-containing protein 2 [Rhagoletis zephyria]
MEEKLEATPGPTRNPIDALSREELLQKYKGLLGIAKKAKQAKDEFAEENRKLKEALVQSDTQKDADKKSLLTMKETLERFTEQKLQIIGEFSELQKKSKTDEETLTKLRIENESLKRQLNRLNEDNEALLKDIDRMEDQLKQVNFLGMEQKKHLGLLELEVNKLKEAESLNSALQSKVTITEEENKALKEQENGVKQALEELSRKYSRVKEINTQQRQKFNALKDRFVEIHRKLKNLKECKRVLLETQHEYAEAISKWQKEIIRASKLLCAQMNALQLENKDLRQKLQKQSEKVAVESSQPLVINFNALQDNLQELENLCAQVRADSLEKDALLTESQRKNEELLKQITASNFDGMVTAPKEKMLEFELLESEVKRLTLELSDLKAVNDPRLKGGEIEKLDGHLEHHELLHRLEAIENERDSLKQQCNKVEGLQLEKHRLENEVAQLMLKLKESPGVHEDVRDELQSLKHEKTVLLAQLKHQESEQIQQNRASEESAKATEQSYVELQARYSQMEREHSDLLCEMRELNEALKARGDVISRQQEKQQELLNELRKTNARLRQIDEVLVQKDAAIAEKEAQVREITHEIDLTREQTHQLEVASTRSEEQLRVLNEEIQSLRSNADAQSEVLSTSTISRAEEMTRMRDVDESFEEKYNKMRGVAVKLKKKLQEQTVRNEEWEQQQKMHEMSNAELDELRKQLKDLKHVHGEHQKLVETLKTENHKLKTSRKQANVLNLEIEAAEKSLNETTSKLAIKTAELEALNKLLSTKENTIIQLRKEIAIVESAKEAEVAHARELKEQVDLLQEQLKDAVHAKQLANQTNKQLEQTQEQLKQELEQTRLEVSKCAAESSTAVLAAQREKEAAEHRLQQTEASLKETQSKLHSVVCALDDLRAEHTEYKQKAQAVLRKHQSTDTTRERELTEELTQLRATEEQQRQTLAAQTKKINDLEQHTADLYLDNENLQRRAQELNALVDNLRQQNDRMLLEQRAQLQTQQESLRAQRQQLEATQECHKQQLLELETNYQRQIEQLRAEQVQSARVPPIIGAAVVATTNSSLNYAPTYSEPNQMQLLMLAEREDGEGSEEATLTANKGTVAVTVAGSSNTQAMRKISSSSRRSQHDFMPLDELLNTPMHAFQTDTVTTISSNSLGRNNSAVFELSAGNSSAESLIVELNVTRELLAKQESRVRHLTALLAENEQDLAKLTQMNDMLKEELRRQERAVEREKHMHNAEYLKNIVLKFLTLTSGDERVRLVPVLNTILKLSRNETEILNCVAKGQKLPTEPQGRSWGSFLPIFGGTGGGGGNNN